MIALALLLAAAPAAPSLASAPALFQRAEPSLDAGARALAAGDVDGAIEKFRRAQPETDDERAIVEYDVGAALLARAALAAAPAEGGAPSQHADPAPQGGTQDGAPTGPDTASLDDARAAFARAYGIAKDRRLKSEAALASGNAAAFASKLDDAIAEYRKSVVADPTNARAKTNLKRALDAKRAQPPPPPSPDDQGGEDDKEPNEEPKDGDKKPNEPKDGDKKPNEPKDGDKKPDEPKDGDKKPDEPKDGDKKPDDKKPEEGKGAQKKKLKKEEAKRLLEMMRSRERPLTPMEMRGEEKKPSPKQGKDW